MNGTYIWHKSDLWTRKCLYDMQRERRFSLNHVIRFVGFIMLSLNSFVIVLDYGIFNTHIKSINRNLIYFLRFIKYKRNRISSLNSTVNILFKCKRTQVYLILLYMIFLISYFFDMFLDKYWNFNEFDNDK